MTANGLVFYDRTDKPSPIEPNFSHAAEITSGDALAHEGKLAEAVALYRQVLASCKTELGSDTSNRQTQAQLYLVASRIGGLARQLLFKGKFQEARACTEQALTYDPNSTALNLDRAHALMFLDHVDEARAIYFGYHHKKMAVVGVRDLIKWDFDLLRKAEYSHVLMGEVEHRFGAAKWHEKLSAPPENTATNEISRRIAWRHAAAPRTETFAPPQMVQRVEPEDIPSGNKFMAQGNLDEAFAVYQRRMRTCNQILSNGIPNLQASGDRYLVVNKISDIALYYLIAGQNEKARAALDYALSEIQLSSSANVRRAHVLMFLGKEKEKDARAIYLQYRDQRMTPEDTGAAFILKDFALMRKGGRVHPLMDEIEALLRNAQPPVGRRRELIR